MQKLLFILIALIIPYCSLYSEQEMDFIQTFKERYKFPEMAIKANFEAEFCFEIYKRTDSLNVNNKYSEWEIFKRSNNNIIKDSIWLKSLPLGHYLFFVSTNHCAVTDDFKQFEYDCRIDSISDAVIQKNHLNPENLPVYKYQINYCEYDQKVYDSLTKCFSNNTKNTWEKEKQNICLDSLNISDIEDKDSVISILRVEYLGTIIEYSDYILLRYFQSYCRNIPYGYDAEIKKRISKNSNQSLLFKTNNLKNAF